MHSSLLTPDYPMPMCGVIRFQTAAPEIDLTVTLLFPTLAYAQLQRKTLLVELRRVGVPGGWYAIR